MTTESECTRLVSRRWLAATVRRIGHSDRFLLALGSAAGLITLMSSGPEIWANMLDLERAQAQSIFRNVLQAAGNGLWLSFGLINAARKPDDKSFRTMIATASLGLTAACILIIQGWIARCVF